MKRRNQLAADGAEVTQSLGLDAVLAEVRVNYVVSRTTGQKRRCVVQQFEGQGLPSEPERVERPGHLPRRGTEMPGGQRTRPGRPGQWITGKPRSVTGLLKEMKLLHVRVDPWSLLRSVGVDLHFVPALDEAGDLVQHERFGEGREVGDNKRNLQGSELLTLSRCDCNLDSRREKLHFHSTESIRPDILGPISHSTARLKMLRKWIHKVSRRFDIAALYSTTVGIKCTNPLIASSRLDGLTNPGVFELSPGELRLGFDGLRDEFTLLKMPIAESPHLDLFRRIDSGN